MFWCFIPDINQCVKSCFDTEKSWIFLNKLISETICLLGLLNSRQSNGSRLTKTKFVRGLVSLDCRLRLLENYFCLLYRRECFTGNETTDRFHTPLHPGPEWRIFRMSLLWVSYRSMTSGLSLKLYINSLVHHRNIFVSSSEVFGNLRTSS